MLKLVSNINMNTNIVGASYNRIYAWMWALLKRNCRITY